MFLNVFMFDFARIRCRYRCRCEQRNGKQESGDLNWFTFRSTVELSSLGAISLPSPSSAVLLVLLKSCGLPRARRMHWHICLFTPSFPCLNSINIYIGTEGVGSPSLSAGRNVSLQTKRQRILLSQVPVFFIPRYLPGFLLCSFLCHHALVQFAVLYYYYYFYAQNKKGLYMSLILCVCVLYSCG